MPVGVGPKKKAGVFGGWICQCSKRDVYVIRNVFSAPLVLTPKVQGSLASEKPILKGCENDLSFSKSK